MPSPIAGAGGGILTPGVAPPLSGPGDMRRGPGTPAYGPTLPLTTPLVLPLINLPMQRAPQGALVAATKRIVSVGEQSTVPYGPTYGYANPNGVTGFIGPAAGGLRKPTTWYCRIGGSNDNGGTSTSLTPLFSGSDGATAVNQFTSASANFPSSVVGHGIALLTGTSCHRGKIIGWVNSTTLLMDKTMQASLSGAVYAIGGCWADLRAAFGDVAVTANTAAVGSSVNAGDTIYLGAGTYRATYSASAATWGAQLFSGANQARYPSYNGIVNIVGDVTGQFTGDAGMVQLTTYTTNDKTAPVGSLIAFNGISNLAFSNIFVKSGTTVTLNMASTSQNISFTGVSFDNQLLASANFVTASFTQDLRASWLFDQCRFFGRTIFAITAPRPTAGDLALNIVTRNSTSIGQLNFTFAVPAGGSGFWGGVNVFNLTALLLSSNFFSPVANMSINTPCLIYNSVICGLQNTCFQATTLGQIVEDYNTNQGFSVIRTATAVGPHTIDAGAYSALVHFGQELTWLPPLPRVLGEPLANSPFLAFGSNGNQTAYDLRGPQNPRPAGDGSFLPAVGALERADTFIADASPIGSGVSPVKLTGPGYNDFLLPIAASQASVARNISVKVQFDSNYAGVLPQMLLVAKPQMGVATQTATAVGTAGNVLTISLATFTPTAGGVLTIRLLSNDLSGASVVEWDDFTIT